MKKAIIMLLAVLSIASPLRAGWFENEAQKKEEDRRKHAEEQLAQQQQTNDGLAVVVLVLAVGVVSALVIGAAVGSKTRRDAI